MPDNPFETRAREYDDWYDQFPNTFRSEILALRALLPPAGKWVEVGVGSGRFAEKLGIPLGVEPAEAMAVLSRSRGIDIIRGRAEALPLESESMDALFFITTLCFVLYLHLALREALRVLREKGNCIVGLLPLDSPLGEITHAHADKDTLFFRDAQLLTRSEVLQALEDAGFAMQQTMQTLSGSPENFEVKVQSPQCGHDSGSFVVIRATKGSRHSPSWQQQACPTERIVVP